MFAYAGGPIAVGLVLWLIARAVSGPTDEIDPDKLVD